MLLQEGKDNINPDHYKNACSIECIDAMLLGFGVKKVVDFCLINAFKYIWRHKNKNGYEDLDKAAWYVDKATQLLDDFNVLYSAEEYDPYAMQVVNYQSQIIKYKNAYVEEEE